ncbi:aminotransferase [Anaerosporomusa subterranea]|uniref:Aminotransferase n=1 Tax=Anaerosporomusa subterranea TaxID=1794912 RepID=A0A154BT82_ANASB|nr:PLP-dependent aminotransferase family protein [Anaerosporomusa subterranea]KYZ77085.1 aminotransferase [Anaerosporomusa subterranea]
MNYSWAERLSGMEDPAIKNLLKTMQRPDVIALSAGSPAQSSFPVAELSAAFSAVLADQGASALQYGISEGYGPLRKWVASRVSRLGIQCEMENVLIGNGSQQVLDLIARILLNPGDYVAVESPTYLAALQIFKGYQARLLPIPMDQDGMLVDQLEAAIQTKRPKFIYVIPSFQNPTGICMSLERRRRLAELAARYEIPVIEDNPYGELRYEGEAIPAIKSLADSPWLMYAGTASKIIAPGLRLGWLVAHPEFIERVATAKQTSDVLSNSLTQRAVHRYVTDNDLDAHIETIINQYRLQRDVMLAAMKQHFPAGVKWQAPHGGMFLWVTLPDGMDASALLPLAVEQAKVSYVPGTPFYADNSGANTLRLNFSSPTPELIAEGIERLGKLLKSYMNG